MEILICSASHEAGDTIDRLVSGIQGATVVARVSTGQDAVDGLSRRSVDLSIVDEEALDIGLVARRQLAAERANHIVWVAFFTSSSVPGVIKAAQFGFDDVVVAPSSSQEFGRELIDIVQNHRSVHTNPLLNSVDVVPGLYVRQIIHSDDLDRDTVELLGLGLGDRDIAVALGRSIQEVRNRLADLIAVNGLSNRTQLATLHIRSQMADRPH